MSRPSKVRPFLRYSALGLLGLLVVIIGTLRIQQWVLRHRAEELLADIQQLELRRTSFEDAQKLFGRWSRWGQLDGECTRKRCQISIMFNDFLERHRRLSKRGSLRLLYAALGGRPTEVYAYINVLDNVVWEKGYGFTSAPRSIVSGKASTVSWLPAADQRFALHPNRTVVPYELAPCVWIATNFTPYEDPAEVRRLMGFDLSVIAHWGLGREKNDVMPAACAEAREERHLVTQPTSTGTGQADSPRHESVEYLARDAGRVALVKTISKPSQSGNPWAPWKLEARLEESLKRFSPRDVGTVRKFHLHCSDVGWVPDIRAGERFLVFTDWNPETENVTCGGFVPVTEENLAAARRGIAQDYMAVFGEPGR